MSYIQLLPVILKMILVFNPDIFLKSILWILILTFAIGCSEGKAKDDFIENFNLKLKGEVLTIEQNSYGQYLVCLKILESNKKQYFPIHDPNKFKSKGSNFWEKRFFVKVQDTSALMILINDGVSRVIHNRIKVGSVIEINGDGKKGYEIFNGSTNESDGRINYIMTAPIRDNIEKFTCVNRGDRKWVTSCSNYTYG